MGSDSVKKRFQNRTQRVKTLLLRCRASKRPFAVIITFTTLLLFLLSQSSQPRIQTNSHEPLITAFEIQAAQKDLPSQCHAALNNFADYLTNASPYHRIVFACHRKWCSSYGHCEPCRGIGDRTRHLLSMVTDAMQKRVAIQIDYPQTYNGVELRFPRALEYQDKFGLMGELFHVRGYDVSDLVIDSNTWGNRPISEPSLWGDSSVEETFVHFIPNHYKLHAFDPCLYHILFQLTKEMRTEVDYYAHLFELELNNVVGIHFRTGDLTAFGVQNQDVRSQHTSLRDNYHKMLSCAESHATALGFSAGSEKLHFYLATDNQKVKEMAKEDGRYVIHMTPDEPAAYLSSNGDKSAFLELNLLSRTRGLVINALPKSYHGPAEVLSTFSMLAFNIGFMKGEQLKACQLD